MPSSKLFGNRPKVIAVHFSCRTFTKKLLISKQKSPSGIFRLDSVNTHTNSCADVSTWLENPFTFVDNLPTAAQ